MSNKHSLIFILASLVLPILWGCEYDSTTVIDRYQSLPPKGWDRQNVLTFSLDSVAHSATYNFKVYARTTRDIQFQSISVVVEQHLRRPYFTARDTVEIKLTDDMGNIEGKGLYLYNTEAQLKHPIKLRKGQRGTIKLSHIMRRNQLLGIKDVGIELTQQKE